MLSVNELTSRQGDLSCSFKLYGKPVLPHGGKLKEAWKLSGAQTSPPLQGELEGAKTPH